MPEPVFASWDDDKHTRLWGRHPIRLEHTLHRSPLFSMEGLAELIDNYPRELYSLVYMGAKGSPKKTWREGDPGGLEGREIIEAIASGRLWLNMRSTQKVDPRYGAILEQMFGEIGAHVTDHDQFPVRSFGILISSPNAQVYYHADLPNQSLWQIAGRKRVYIYPSAEPFITAEDLERISVFELEVDMPYAAWYDEHAVVYDLEPGQMLHWPLNAPHRVENYDCLNVSITTEYWALETQRRHKVHMANGLMRYRFGMKPGAGQITGPGFWARNVLQAAARRTGWLDEVRKARRPIDFKLDRQRPGGIVDLEARPAA
jgi:hypothetical protein